ncbi:MAG: DNA mismatch repair endonuclease MutL [Gemmatimonadota bacterium]|nr:DNA mismatch repair endonuclease MutL [Gemmatimonadota bacterium]
MARTIEVLPDLVANQIAAGEVVERPASLVKELIENALDAGARRIEVVIQGGGKRLVRVTDDGHGMSREDAVACLDRHATSKIKSAEDLRRVASFGFRGEALPSIAAVSRLALETAHAGPLEAPGGLKGVGTRVRVEGGRVTAVDDHARQPGTTVEVRALFFNAPARACFLRSVSTEARRVSDVVIGLALAKPSVGFALSSDGRPLVDLPPARDLPERITAVWGVDTATTLLPVELLIEAGSGGGGVELRGLVQRPDAVRPGLRRVHLLVNGRPFKNPGLVRAADDAYRSTVAPGMRPWLFLELLVPTGSVDVNVHPSKAAVRFRDTAAVEAAVEAGVRSALAGVASSASFDQVPAPPPMTAGKTSERTRLRTKEPPGAQTALFVPAPASPAPSDDQEVPFPRHAGEDYPRLFQLHHTYIVAEARDGMLIIDQHSAHERVLFERMMRAFDDNGQPGQRLLFPITLQLPRPEYEQVDALAGILERAGFEVEGFGGDAVIVRAVPDPHPWFDAERCLREMIAELTHGSELVRSARNQHERIGKTFACKAAIKAGQRLSDEEMTELFDALFATELPWHDVHGRPTVVRLSAAELARKFGR